MPLLLQRCQIYVVGRRIHGVRTRLPVRVEGGRLLVGYAACLSLPPRHVFPLARLLCPLGRLWELTKRCDRPPRSLERCLGRPSLGNLRLLRWGGRYSLGVRLLEFSDCFVGEEGIHWAFASWNSSTSSSKIFRLSCGGTPDGRGGRWNGTPQ